MSVPSACARTSAQAPLLLIHGLPGASAYYGPHCLPDLWSERNDIEASDERLARARDILQNQPCTTIAAMARSVLAVTGAPG